MGSGKVESGVRGPFGGRGVLHLGWIGVSGDTLSNRSWPVQGENRDKPWRFFACRRLGSWSL